MFALHPARSYLKIMRRLSAVDGDVDARKALLEDDLKRTDKIMMMEKVHPDKMGALKMKMNIIGSFFYNGLSSSGPPSFDNEDIEVPHNSDGYQKEEQDEGEEDNKEQISKQEL